MNFRSWRLSTRLFLAFGVVVLLSVLSNGYALAKLNEIETNLEEVVTETNVKAALSNRMAESVHVVSRVIRTTLLITNEKERLDQQRKLDAARQTYDNARAELEKFTPSAEGKALRAEIDASAAAAVAVFKLGHGASATPAVRADTASPSRAGAPATPKFTDRRSPHRATNVTRPAFGKATPPVPRSAKPAETLASATGTNDWETF